MKNLIAIIMIVSILLGMSVTASFASGLVLVNDSGEKSETRSFYWNGSDDPANVCQTNWSGSFWTGYIKTQPKKSYAECQLPVLIPIRETRSFYWNGSDDPNNVCQANWTDSIWTGSVKTKSKKSYVECQLPVIIPVGELRNFYWNGSDNPDNVCKTNWLDSIWTGSIKTRSNRSYVECQFIPIPGGGGFIHPPNSANIGG